MAIKLELIDLNGTTWDLTTGPIRAALGGIEGLGIVKTQDYTRTSPMVAGQYFTGDRAQARDVFLPLHLLGSPSTWYALSSQFWSGIEPGRYVTLRVTVPNQIPRSILMRFTDDGPYTPNRDPSIIGVESFGLAFVADDPWWRGPERVIDFAPSEAAVSFFEPPTATYTNLAAYGSMETAQSGTTEVRRNLANSPFSNGQAAPSGQVSLSRFTQASSDQWSALTLTDANSAAYAQRVQQNYNVAQPVLPGATVTASAEVMAGGSWSAEVAVAILWLDSSRAALGGYVSTEQVIPTREGKRISSRAVAPAGAAYVTWVLGRTSGSSAVGDVLMFRNVLLEQTDQLRPYFDGSTPNEKGFTTEWAGTANASASIMRAATVTVRENLYTDPAMEGATVGGVNGGSIAYVAMPTGRGARVTVAAGGTQDAGVRVGNAKSGLTSGVTYTVSILITANVAGVYGGYLATPAAPSTRTNFTMAAGETRRWSITFTASQTVDSSWTWYMLRGNANAADFTLSAPMVEVSSVLSDFFGGHTPNSGDFINAWTGAANASTSVQQGVKVAGVLDSSSKQVNFRVQEASNAFYRLRFGESGIAIGANLIVSGLNTTKAYTVVTRVRASAAMDIALRMANSVGPYERLPAGEWVTMRALLYPTSSSSDFTGLLYRASSGAGVGVTLDWDDMTIVEGNHPNLMPFDGSSKGGSWSGTPYASTSFLSTATAVLHISPANVVSDWVNITPAADGGEVWPTITLKGPLTSWEIFLQAPTPSGASLVNGTIASTTPLSGADTLVINTNPAAQTAILNGSTNFWPQLTRREFIPLQPGRPGFQSLAWVNLNGQGSASINYTDQFRRAW